MIFQHEFIAYFRSKINVANIAIQCLDVQNTNKHLQNKQTKYENYNINLKQQYLLYEFGVLCREVDFFFCFRAM